MNSALLYVYIGGSAFGILLTAALLAHKRDAIGNWLAFLILLVSVDELFYSIQHFPAFPFPALIRLSGYAGLLFAPLWFLLMSGRAAQTANPLKYWWHYLFFTVCQLLAVCEVVVPSSLPWLTVHNLQDLVAVLLMSSYLISGVLIMKRKSKPVNSLYYFRDRKVAFVSLAMMYGAYLISATANLAFDDAVGRTVASLGYCVITLSLMLLAFSVVYQAASSTEEQVDVVVPDVPTSDKEKYGNNRLPDFVRKSIIDRLNEYMTNEQPWLKIDLTLSDLAAAINLNPHHLSQIINSEFGKSFACFINEYRVEAARHLLAVSDNKTVIEIALESGFASKSSFNALFKKHTGVTPSEYRRMSRNESGVEPLQRVS